MKKFTLLTICLVVVLFLFAGCTATRSTPEKEEAAGFFKGLWHGFIMLFTFIVSLFKDDMAIYETHNSGHLYDLGYLIGIMIFFGGSSGGACKKKC